MYSKIDIKQKQCKTSDKKDHGPNTFWFSILLLQYDSTTMVLKDGNMTLHNFHLLQVSVFSDYWRGHFDAYTVIYMLPNMNNCPKDYPAEDTQSKHKRGGYVRPKDGLCGS